MLFILLGVYFLWRILFLLWTHPLNLFLYAEEEFYRGFIGKEILHGLKLPFYDYRADDYSGGSLVMGGISSAVFKFAGTHAFAFKLIPVVIFAFALSGWYHWLAKYQSKRLAVCFSLLFIFSPFVFTRFTLTVLGDHSETIAFTAISLCLLFKILSEKKPAWIYPALLGLLAGTAFWIAYIYGITLIAMMFYWFLRDKEFFKTRSFWIFAAGLLAGLTPWMIGNALTNLGGLSLAGTPFLKCFHWKYFLKRIIDFRHSAPYLLFAVHALPGVVPEISPIAVTRFYRIVFLVPILFLLIAKIYDNRNKVLKLSAKPSPVEFSFLYLACFLLICQATLFKEIRYFIPPQPFVFFLALYGVDRFASRYRVRFQSLINAAYVGGLIAVSIFLHTFSFHPQYAGTLFEIKPASIQWLLLSPVCANPESCLQTYSRMKDKEHLEAQDRQLWMSGVSQKLLEEMRLTNPDTELASLKKRSPEELHPFMDYYFGYELFERREIEKPGGDTLPWTVQQLQTLRLRSAESYRLALLGMFRYPLPLPQEKPNLPELASTSALLPEAVQPEYLRQIGYLLADWMHHEKKDFSLIVQETENAAQAFTPAQRNYFFQGVGSLFYQDWYLAPYHSQVSWFKMEKLKPEISRGLLEGAGFAWFSNHDPLAVVYKKMFFASISETAREYFESGIEYANQNTGGVYRI